MVRFRAHQANLIEQIDTISGILSAQTAGEIGYAKVILRREAWAKSHRPVNSLFRPDRVATVGGGDLGVMLVEVRPNSLSRLAQEIAAAEPTTRMKLNEKRGRAEPNPSVRKSEAGAIDRIELFGPADRRAFSLEEALVWLSNPMTGSGYQIELFEVPPPRSEWDRLDAGRRRLVQSFAVGLAEIGFGLTVERLPDHSNKRPILNVRLDQSRNPPVIRLQDTSVVERRRVLAPFNPDRARHSRLLKFLDNHPLVRRIELPGIVVHSARAPMRTPRARPNGITIPVRDSRRSHPRLGIIDGGIGPALSDWVIDRWDVLADEDMDLAHGTFIGGLAALGGALNGAEVCPEPDGAELVDLAVFPSEGRSGAFTSYFPDGLPQFFDEMESAVSDANARHGVRVFNMSLNILQPAAPDRYSQHAARLDQIAENSNSVIFISAGNINPQDLRAEWPNDDLAALTALVNSRNDGLLTPAESARNVAVAALNPPGHDGCVPFAPTRFSRRGPGLRGGVKPEIAHVGGSGSQHAVLGHGLFSVLPDGTIVDGCGTSYASPLAAKTAAVLDHLIEGEVSRETLIGLLVHHAEMPALLRSKTLAPVARHMVGFGMPPSAGQILETGDHAITLVFASRIQRDQQINFRFAWPPSLVGPGGKCRGRAKLTLVATPPLDARFGSELVRINVNASLQQEQEDGGWKGRLDSLYLPPRG
ncbi:S8 family peptidase [Lichenibacterium minor]|uniref:S8 family peptidase n=1 Tax=Lichenibacterium minor TaxID=2316528 RepID=UPI001FE1E59D|nr:S8 family peptidase [Lichenibacterium minor]